MNFIILGMGYVSKYHLPAIKAVGGNLVAFHDISDVMGHVDSYFINAKYYQQFIHFDCFVDRYLHSGGKIDYAVILLPNHLHNPACRWALNRGMDVIVEKPVVLYEKNIDELLEVEARTGHKVNTIYQLRHHPGVIDMKSRIDRSKRYEVAVDYASSRGSWYIKGAWKSDPYKSGGLSSNIGCHLFDVVCHFFGKMKGLVLFEKSDVQVRGLIETECAKVKWRLSVGIGEEPKRLFQINGEQLELSNGFTSLHEEAYRNIISGNGIGLEDARLSVEICENIREMTGGMEGYENSNLH